MHLNPVEFSVPVRIRKHHTLNGFGFAVRQDDGGPDVFIPNVIMARNTRPGPRSMLGATALVDIAIGAKGPVATDMRNVVLAPVDELADAPHPVRTIPVPAPEGPMRPAHLKFLDMSKGFGFVILEDKTEVFVHFAMIVANGVDPQYFKTFEIDRAAYNVDGTIAGKTFKVALGPSLDRPQHMVHRIELPPDLNPTVDIYLSETSDEAALAEIP